jgi:hypothetical protein
VDEEEVNDALSPLPLLSGAVMQETGLPRWCRHYGHLCFDLDSMMVRWRGCTSRAGLAGHGLATHSPVQMVQVLVFVNMAQRSRA